jgi:aminoglycoside 6'-N-acetyltransferase I
MITIEDLHADDQAAIHQAAALLVKGFVDVAPAAWPNMAAAHAEVTEALEPGKIIRAARAADGSVLGWVGGQHDYAAVWELHPLVVDPAHQGQGIGRALVADLEAQVAKEGGLTLQLGTDDENELTSLSGVDLYPDVWQHIRQIRNYRRHPYSFYEKCGFVIVGVVPDANGFGRPDILMAKRVTPAGGLR